MLNGKFYTGLPPKMIDRGGAGANRNRLESHFFWPDDTQVDNAVESRVKRRNSIQLANKERPSYEKQTSMFENKDVDTKKRFSKEFSQSSIQFFDNLNEDRSNSRRNLLRNRRMELAEKPTKTRMELPENVVDEAYTTAKKKQAYTSKIEFYDYVNDSAGAPNNRNNLRKPKMDMNDKREMELNSKNSPKLQVKRDVRSLSEEKDEPKLNNRDVRLRVRPEAVKRSETLNYGQRERNRILNNEEHYLQSRRSVEPRMNASPKRGLGRISNKFEQRYCSERELYREPVRGKAEYYENERDNRRVVTPDSYENHKFSQREREEPKRLARNNSRQYYESPEDRDYAQDYRQEEVLSRRVKNLSLRSPTRKPYYEPEEYFNEDRQYYQRHSDQVKPPTRRGSSQEHFDYNEPEVNEVDLPYERNNSPKRFNNINKINNQIRGPSPKSPPASDAESFSASTNSRKHLRSNLCFNDGAIIGENDAVSSPTPSSTSQYPTQRRNARSSATQRVSVGLPD